MGMAGKGQAGFGATADEAAVLGMLTGSLLPAS